MYNYKWKLKDTVFTKDKGKVFSCFACGGGSSMGYKLAGFDVIGVNEIDPKMMEVYKINHNPKYSYLEGIQTFKNRNDLPSELFDLDILDGSPPCSSFSMAGNRGKDWGKKKKFREGQSEQVLDTLFFDFIDLAKKLQPKIVIAENVKGLLMGEAVKYVREIGKRFNRAGYVVEKWLLDASKMGVPQRRERVFFIAVRKNILPLLPKGFDLFSGYPALNLEFYEPEIPFSAIEETNVTRDSLANGYLKHWKNADHTGRAKAESGNTFGFFYKAIGILPLATITSGGSYTIESKPELLTNNEYCNGGSFPLDYNYLENNLKYLIGMSVPPVMIAQIATRIYDQWLSKLNILST